MDKPEVVDLFRFVTYTFTCKCGHTYRLPCVPWKLRREEDTVRCPCGRIWRFSSVAHTENVEHISRWCAINDHASKE
jgi:hypothetical protein